MVNGNLGDKGFYDSSAAGIAILNEEYGCETKIIEMGRDETTYETYLRDVSEQDWDLIVGSTWSMTEVIQEVAVDYPDQEYLLIDSPSETENVMGVSFSNNENGFIAGVLAAKQLLAGGEKIDSSKKILGFIGSMDIPAINDFLVGYVDGVQYVDDSIKIITSYVGSFEDVATCLEMTTQLYNQGAQIVYTPTSQSQIGAITASSDCDKYMIASDNDVYEEMKDVDGNLVRNVISSSMKYVGNSLVVAAVGLWDGELEISGNYTMGLPEEAVGLAYNDNYEALSSDSVRSDVEGIIEKYVAGEIEIGSAFTMETEEIYALIDSIKP